jgi:hypothetical protein
MKAQRVAMLLTGINIVLLAAILLQGRPVAAQPVPQVIRAQSMEIVDGQGRVRFHLAAQPDGEAVFRMRDGTGTIRVKLSASEEGSGLLLLDAETEAGLHVLAKRSDTVLTLKRGKEQRVFRPER